MQIKIFTVSIHDDGVGADELNRFLRAHRILEVEREFVTDGGGSCWCFCVRYLDGPASGSSFSDRNNRVDYRELLDAATFAKFSELRIRRKAIAEADGLPAYVVFTDEQLAEMAKLAELTPVTMAKVKGVGAGKIERYAARLLDSAENGASAEKKGEDISSTSPGNKEPS